MFSVGLAKDIVVSFKLEDMGVGRSSQPRPAVVACIASSSQPRSHAMIATTKSCFRAMHNVARALTHHYTNIMTSG